MRVNPRLRLLDAALQSSASKCALTAAAASEWLESNPALLGKVRRALLAGDAEAAQGVVEAVKFMWLVASERTLAWTPSHRVDLVWHELLLFTRSYDQFCRDELGGFVHHEPTEEALQNQDAFERTLAAYRIWYGEPNEVFWGHRRAGLAACGTCESVGD